MRVKSQYHNGEPIAHCQLNSSMGLVVNSSEGVTELLSESGYMLEHDGIGVMKLLADEDTPRTPIERYAEWAAERGGLLSLENEDAGNLTRITIIVDEDDADKLADPGTRAESVGREQ